MAFGLIGASCLTVAAGIYTLVKRQLPPIFFDVEGEGGAPEVAPDEVNRWGVGFLVFGIVLGAVTWYGAVLRGATSPY